MIEQASLVIGEGNWAVKSDSLLGYKINNGKYYPREMSVVRATTGTRINEDGLVEVVPYNLLRFSEDFTQSSPIWNKYQSTITGNTTTAPDGTLTADSITDNSANDVHITYQILNVNAGVNTISVYAKANTLSNINLQLYDGVSAFYTSNAFNLSTGTTTGANQSIENVGNGWYRCSYTITTTQTGTQYVYVMTNNGSSNVYVGTGKSLFIWGAQLVEGSSALDYLPTTDRLDVARIDYSSGSAALLVEPQRTNLLTYSSSFDNAAWVKYYVTANANTTISPSGIQDADKLVETSDNNIHLIIQGTLWNTNARTATIYAKAAERTKVFIANTSSAQGSFFNLANGTIEGNIGSFTSTIEDVGNGWYRCTATHTAAASQTFAIGIYTNYTGNFVTTTEYAGTNGSGIYIWGAQLEAGSYPTSLIPTQGSTVTRNADVISKTGIADLIGQTEGTLYFDFEFNGNNESIICDISATGFSPQNRIVLYQPNNYYVQLVILNNNAEQVNIVSPNYALGQRLKVGVAYKNNDFAFYINGVLIGTDTSGSVPATSRLDIGNRQDLAFPSTISVNAAALFKTRLTNAELATLTTI